MLELRTIAEPNQGRGTPAPPQDAQTMLRPIWRRRWLILALVVVATTATYSLASRQPAVYTASTNIYVGGSDINTILFGSTDTGDDRNNNNLVVFLLSKPVADEAARILRTHEAPSALLAHVAASPASGSDFVRVTATGPTAERAAALANAVAKAFTRARSSQLRDQARVAQQAAQRELNRLHGSPRSQASQRDLRQRIQRLRIVATLPEGSAQQVELAVPPGAPTSPRPRRNALFAFGLALLLAVGLAYLLESVDRHIRNADEIPALYGYELVGAIPHFTSRATMQGALTLHDDAREAFRSLWSGLRLATLDATPKLVLVTSASRGDGKTTIVRNLALAICESGLRVIVVELDMRRPTLATTMGIASAPGITDVLLGNVTRDEALQDVPVEMQGLETIARLQGRADDKAVESGTLTVITCGPPPANPPAILNAAALRDLLRDIAEDYDVVILDSAPLIGGVSDTLPILGIADAVLVVARVGHSRRDEAGHLRGLVQRIAPDQMVGIVANDLAMSGRDGYGYGYDYRAAGA